MKGVEKKVFENKYGYFTSDGMEYVIQRPDTPRPWANVLTNGRYGMIVSQTGGGYSWLDNASINRINRWEQDLIQDNWGKFIYLRDDDQKTIGSLTWKPVCSKLSKFECRHGIGYTTLEGEWQGIRGKVTYFVPNEKACEVWMVELENLKKKTRKISLFTYFEWLLGRWPDSHREFHRLFIETDYDSDNQAIVAQKRFWDVPNAERQYWNCSYPYHAFHASSVKPAGYECDKEPFIGRYGNLMVPAAVQEGHLGKHVGKWNDSIASLHLKFVLKPLQKKECVFVTGLAQDQSDIKKILKSLNKPELAKKELEKVKNFWKNTLAGLTVETPDQAMNFMTNTWLKYQAIAGRIWGRTGYYQGGGAYGYRDQLQDSHIFLPLNSEKTANQIKLHAEHQFVDGTTYHWWQNITKEGSPSKHSDDLLWLPFVLMNYLKESGDFSILNIEVPYINNEGVGTIYDHCKRAIQKVFERMSPRGIPLIGEGDWNDGLNATGRKWKGESVWLGHFFYGILKEFPKIAEKQQDFSFAHQMGEEAGKLKKVLNTTGWDGQWYWRATTDSGKVLGSQKCKEAKIFLNAQTWAIICGVPDSEKRFKLVKKMAEKYLYRDYGPLLFYPAYKEPDPEVGYLTRYPAGMRENGGLYTHAGVWGIWAECVLKDGSKAYETYNRINPVRRGSQPDLYYGEPYVLPGNVDGPESPNYGRGGWTWYTGSAAWFFRMTTEWILGIRPDYDGLMVDPCIPKDWKSFKMTRKFRKDIYEIEVKNPRHVSSGVKELMIDGVYIDSNIIKPFNDGKKHKVDVILG